MCRTVPSGTRTGNHFSDGTHDTTNKVHRKKGDKSDVTMSYCSVCKRWEHHNVPGNNTWQDTQGGDSGTGGHATAAMADVGTGEDLGDEFITFIG